MTIKLFLTAAVVAVSTMAGVRMPRPASLFVPRDVTERLSARTSFATAPPAAWRADDPADSLYRVGREQLNRGDYRNAAQTFARIVERYPQSTYAADALYWEAYAQYRLGEKGDLRSALSALETQRTQFPKASTRGDADALAVRIRGALARLGDGAAAESIATQAAQAKPCTTRGGDDVDEGNDDDLRIAALNSLLQMNAEQAMPILRQVLAKRDACSASLRAKAVFLVSQKRTAETEDILLDVVRNDPSAGVKKKAVFWLGQVNSDRAAQALATLLTSSGTSEELREEAVVALMQQRTERGEAAVRAIAQDDQSPASLREKAVFRLGQNRSAANASFLRGLFARLASATGGGERNEAVAQKILFSLSQRRGEGNDRWLMEIAADPKYTVETRKQAIFSAGQIRVPTSELTALYDKLTDRELKEQLIWVLSDRHDTAAMDRLIEIAKRDPDLEMRKKAIFWLGQSHDPRVKQLLLDIINGG
jgi:TolA-binding protein